ncbi:hypothetical protein SAMN05444166_1392 [Singulisphaera sp. GP187]|nr:hypothetical protein SAMN05444166_1392 [Singulisphaera sp. GP187]
MTVIDPQMRTNRRMLSKEVAWWSSALLGEPGVPMLPRDECELMSEFLKP